MSKSIKLPIAKMIDMLSKISNGGRLCHMKTPQSNTSKISHLFKHEISAFYTHYTLTRNLLLNSSEVNMAVNYQKLFKKYINAIFVMFFKVKAQAITKKRNFVAYFVKCLPCSRLYIKTKKLIDSFMKREESKFNLVKLRKNMFIINSFLDTDDESEANEEPKSENDTCINSISKNINNTDENC